MSSPKQQQQQTSNDDNGRPLGSQVPDPSTNTIIREDIKVANLARPSNFIFTDRANLAANFEEVARSGTNATTNAATVAVEAVAAAEADAPLIMEANTKKKRTCVSLSKKKFLAGRELFLNNDDDTSLRVDHETRLVGLIEQCPNKSKNGSHYMVKWQMDLPGHIQREWLIQKYKGGRKCSHSFMPQFCCLMRLNPITPSQLHLHEAQDKEKKECCTRNPTYCPDKLCSSNYSNFTFC